MVASLERPLPSHHDAEGVAVLADLEDRGEDIRREALVRFDRVHRVFCVIKAGLRTATAWRLARGGGVFAGAATLGEGKRAKRRVEIRTCAHL